MAASRRGKLKLPPCGTIVAVRWEDAWAQFGQSKLGDWGDVCEVTTYGVLVRANDEIISVAWERLGDGTEPLDLAEFRSITHIPRSIVTSVKVLS